MYPAASSLFGIGMFLHEFLHIFWWEQTFFLYLVRFGVQMRFFNTRKPGPPAKEIETADPLWFHEMKAPSYETEIRCFIGLGSNLGEEGRLRNLECVLADVMKFGTILATSGLYESLPEGDGKQDEPRYINSVIELSTSLPPHELYVFCSYLCKFIASSKHFFNFFTQFPKNVWSG